MPLWYPLAIVLFILLRCKASYCLFGIFWSLCCLFFFDVWLLIASLVSSNLSSVFFRTNSVNHLTITTIRFNDCSTTKIYVITYLFFANNHRSDTWTVKQITMINSTFQSGYYHYNTSTSKFMWWKEHLKRMVNNSSNINKTSNFL